MVPNCKDSLSYFLQILKEFSAGIWFENNISTLKTKLKKDTTERCFIEHSSESNYKQAGKKGKGQHSVGFKTWSMWGNAFSDISTIVPSMAWKKTPSFKWDKE